MQRHPFFYILVRLALRRMLFKEGYNLKQITSGIHAATDELVDLAAAEAGAPEDLGTVTWARAITPSVVATDGSVGAFGDGHIIRAIKEFLESPLGQALLQALFTLIMMFL